MIKEYYLSILSGHKNDLISAPIRFLLSSFSLLYLIVLQIRRALYSNRIVKSHRLSVKVISVGNITTGGTGKTPLVEFLAHYLTSQDKKIAILSRGYGDQTAAVLAKEPLSRDCTIEGTLNVNDEYLLLRDNLDNIPVLLGRDRIVNGQKAIRDYGAECLILDDGFQHIKLKRDLDIVVIDALNPFSGEHLIPRGTLREPLKGLERADLVVLSHCDQVPESDLRAIYSKLQDFKPPTPICESNHQPVYLESLLDKRRVETSWLSKKRVYGLCAIGNPQSFANTLKELGADVVQFRTFLDHHAYTQVELDDTITEAKSLHVDAIVVTQKDAVKMKRLTFQDVSIMSLVIKIRLTKGASFLDEAISNLLNGDKKSFE